MKVEIPKPLITRKLTREEKKTLKTPWLTGRGTRWMVVIAWWVRIDGVWYLVPAGYIFNGSSIPWFLWWLFPPTYDPAWEASCFHDYCYSHLWRLVSKAFADSAFRGIMRAMGSKKWVSNVFYKAVKKFGKGGW